MAAVGGGVCYKHMGYMVYVCVCGGGGLVNGYNARMVSGWLIQEEGERGATGAVG